MKPDITVRTQSRGYYTRPTQGGGRDVYDYGRTQLRHDHAPVWPYVRAWFYVIAGAVVIGNLIEWIAPK